MRNFGEKSAVESPKSPLKLNLSGAESLTLSYPLRLPYPLPGIEAADCCWCFLSNPGGHFICKTFDLFTPFSVGLIYLLYCCFERVCLFKPITSRPANSER